MKKEGADIVSNAIKNLQNKEDYDEWHKKLCEELVDKYNDDNIYKKDKKGNKRPFTYGIAQKWINMTMKYLCVITSVMAEYDNKFYEDYNDFLKKIEKDLHVPIDSYILECINENKTSWSKIEIPNDYSDLQDKIKNKSKNELPLDWEGPAWIRIAKDRKQKEEQNKRKKYEQ